MKLKDVWKKKEVTLSFEAFPPKKDSDFASVASAVEKIAQLKPDFMSVTYGAGVHGEITPAVPASILQLHNDVTIVADADALNNF